MWAKFDDRFHENRKIKRAWRRCPAAIGMHVMAITYSAGHLTDGFVDVDFVEDRMPQKRAREKAVSVLVDVGLWLTADEGWIVNDFSEFNETKADIEAKRAAKSNAGKKGAAKRWGDANDVAPAIAAASSRQASSVANDGSVNEPDPTRPVNDLPPNPPKSGGRKRDRDRYEDQVRSFVAEHFPDHPERTAIGLTKHAMSELVGATTVAEVIAYVNRQCPVGAQA